MLPKGELGTPHVSYWRMHSSAFTAVISDFENEEMKDQELKEQKADLSFVSPQNDHLTLLAQE